MYIFRIFQLIYSRLVARTPLVQSWRLRISAWENTEWKRKLEWVRLSGALHGAVPAQDVLHVNIQLLHWINNKTIIKYPKITNYFIRKWAWYERVCMGCTCNKVFQGMKCLFLSCRYYIHMYVRIRMNFRILVALVKLVWTG